MYRILWCALLLLGSTLVIGTAYLWTGRGAWDALLVGAIEVGLVLNVLGLVTGVIWTRPTWGVRDRTRGRWRRPRID